MTSKAFYKSLMIFSLIAALLFGSSSKIQAAEDHPFYKDVKEAYKNSNLLYDANVERVLYSKLPEPQDMLERDGFESELPNPKNSEEEKIMLQTIEALYRQFFRKVKTGGKYCPVKKIKEHFGKSPKERIGVSSGGYYRLFVAFWTLEVKLEINNQRNISKYGYGNVFTIDTLLRFVASNLEEVFFPSIDPTKINETQRRKSIRDLLKSFAPKMTIKELFQGADPGKVGLPILK